MVASRSVNKAKKRSNNIDNRWYLRWRHLAAYVFLTIVMFDFCLMPLYYETIHNIDIPNTIQLALKFSDSTSRVAVIQLLLSKKSWEPITLHGNGVFFLCFGAILGIASWTRGSEKISYIRSGKQPEEIVDDPDDTETYDNTRK